jgi:osmotically-inducible protein OsmY
VFLALLVGAAIGAAAIWFITSNHSLEEQLRSLHLGTNDIREELAKTGQVVRQKAKGAGQAIADATVDARITATIKAKFLADPDLSALSISVNTTAGVVTLSGMVERPEDVGKAMVLALNTEGVNRAISTLQVKAKEKG